eukprot:m51a1_g4923 hypothetical protein (232) ;mRNA; r:245948-246824
MEPTARRAVIWDIDGTLIDSYEAHLATWQAGLRAFGRDMTREQYDMVFGKTSRETFELLFPDGTADEHARVLDLKERLYREALRRRFPVMPGAEDLIDALAAASYRQAIGSSGPPENVKLTVELLRNGRHMEAVVDASMVSRGKPDPEVFLRAAQLLGVPPEDCAVLEDSPVGIEAARRAGMTPVALLGTASREKLIERGAVEVFQSLTELSPARIGELIERHKSSQPRGQ